MRRYLCMFCLLLFLPGCAGNAEKEPVEPEAVVQSYFDSLYEEEYAQVVQYYGGSYDTLQSYHPEIDGDDHVSLMKAYIKVSGGQMVKIDSILSLKEVTADEEYAIEVKFIDQEGKSFRDSLIYTYTVKRINGQYKVMELPPYLS